MAAAIVIDRDRVLLCHRHPDRRWYPNVWDLPGGHVETNESPSEELVREPREELGIEVTRLDPEPFRTYDPDGGLTLYAWIVTQWDGRLENIATEEHDTPRWFRADEIAGLELADSR